MSTFSTSCTSLHIRIDLLRDAVRVRLAALTQAVRDRLKAAGQHATAISSSAHRAVGLGTARIRALAAPGLTALRELGRRPRATVKSLVPPLRHVLAVAAVV